MFISFFITQFTPAYALIALGFIYAVGKIS